MGWSPLKTGGSDWDNTQFLVDTPNIVADVPFDLAVSDDISNNADAENLDVFVRFVSMDPGMSVPKPGGGFQDPTYWISVYVEEEITAGVWKQIAESFGQPLNKVQDAGGIEASFIIQTKNTTDPGQPFNTVNGFKWFVNENPSEKIRVRVCVREQSPGGLGALVSVNVTGAYRLY